MRVTTTIKSDRKKWNSMKTRLNRGKNARINVGWFAGQMHTSGHPTAQIAQWNEEGNFHIPSRPFIRNGFIPAMKYGINKHYVPLIAEIAEGKITWTILKSRLKQDSVLTMQQVIKDWHDPPNRPSTIMLKGFNDPLIEMGTLFATVKAKEDRVKGGIK